MIVGAAVYQLTPLKDVCLRHCRNPFMFIMQHWRPGRLGALRMGVLHGGWCVGCCWMLMAALFALGVMSLGWMAFIAALIAVEKLLPWKALANRGVAVLLLVLGLAVAFTPEDVPGLTLPDSPEARQAMESMGMEGESQGSGADGRRVDGRAAVGDRGGGGMQRRRDAVAGRPRSDSAGAANLELVVGELGSAAGSAAPRGPRSAARCAAAPTNSRKRGSGRVGRD